MGVSGVAIATTLSQTLTAIIVLTYLFKNKTAIKFKTSELKIDFSLLKQILYFGLPAGIQSMLITFSNIIVQYYIKWLWWRCCCCLCNIFQVGKLYLDANSCNRTSQYDFFWTKCGG